MGWSANRDACWAEEEMRKILQAAGNRAGTSNGWTVDGADYFCELGREQRDGSITGTVFRMTPDGAHCRKVGSLKISPDGAVLRWPGSSAVQRAQASKAPASRMRELIADRAAHPGQWVAV